MIKLIRKRISVMGTAKTETIRKFTYYHTNVRTNTFARLIKKFKISMSPIRYRKSRIESQNKMNSIRVLILPRYGSKSIFSCYNDSKVSSHSKTVRNTYFLQSVRMINRTAVRANFQFLHFILIGRLVSTVNGNNFFKVWWFYRAC